MAQIETKAGTFDVIEKDGKTVVCKNGKALATLKGVSYWDKDSIVAAIEQNADHFRQMAGKTANGNITPENVIGALEHIYEMLNETIDEPHKKAFVTSRLKSVINKLAA